MTNNHYIHNYVLNKSIPYTVVENGNIKELYQLSLMHAHSQLQIIQVISGSLILKTLHSETTVSTYQIVFINKNTFHQIISNKNCNYRSFIFDSSMLEIIPDSLLSQKYVSAYINNPSIDFKLIDNNDLFFKLNILFSSNNEYEISFKLIEIWYIISSFLEMPKEDFDITSNKKENTLKKSLEYIELNYSDEITLSKLSTELFISKSTIQRLFIAHLSCSPYDYIINFRVNKSLSLLLTTDYSISEIAFLVGFNSTSQYIKHFKLLFNTTPKKYKANSLLA